MVRPFSSHSLLQAWEQGEGQHPVDRALTLLGFACPDRSWEELAHLSIAERDALLLELRECTLGRRLDGYAACPACGEQVEFGLDTRDLRPAEEGGPALPGGRLEIDGLELRFRLPDSLDLAAVAACPDPAAGRALLLRHCLLHAHQGGTAIDAGALPVCVTEALAAHMSTSHPLAELLLELDCPGCGRRWPVALDLASFFWTEVAALAQRLLWEVHLLAGAYGWREADILAMSACRRAAYLEMASR